MAHARQPLLLPLLLLLLLLLVLQSQTLAATPTTYARAQTAHASAWHAVRRVRAPKPAASASPPVAIIVQVIKPALIAAQIDNLRHMLREPFAYHVIDGSTPAATADAVASVASQHGAVYHRCDAHDLAACMDWSVGAVAAAFEGEFVLFVNIDMFLLKPWSVRAHFEAHAGPDVMAVVEDHVFVPGVPAAPLPGYLHPNLFAVNMTRARAVLPSLSFAQWPGTDLGGATRAFVDAHPHLRVAPMMWSRHVDVDSLYATGLVSSQTRDWLATHTRPEAPPDLYTADMAWYHVRDVSCWTGSCEADLEAELPRLLDGVKNGTHTFADASPDPVQMRALLASHNASTTSGNAVATADGAGFLTGLPQSTCIEDGDAGRRRDCLFRKHIVLRPRYGFNTDAWMTALYDRVRGHRVKVRATFNELSARGRVPLPDRPPAPRTNAHIVPARYDAAAYARDTSYYWRYVYNGTQDAATPPEVPCVKQPGQRYWAVTVAIGDTRRKLAEEHTRPSCLAHAVDEFVLLTDADFDADFVDLNRQTLAAERGRGMWIWKHWAQYKVMERMADGDVLFYVDSDFECAPATRQYFCLAHRHPVVGFHHSHPNYTLARLASRDAMLLMGLDTPEVAASVQASGGTILFRKSAFAVDFVTEMASWSQQHEVACCYGQASKLGDDWPQYAVNREHQCDQAVSSLLLVKHGLKTFPWHMEGFGAGSDDDLNAAQRRECGLDESAITVHVRDDGSTVAVG